MNFIKRMGNKISSILSDKTTFKLLLTIIGILLFLIVLFNLASIRVETFFTSGLISANEIPQLFNAYLKTFAQLFGGLAIFAGLYFTYKRMKALEENVKVAQESQITDRYTRAIEQLDNAEVSIRIGALHGLKRIASDSEKDLVAVSEVIASSVRENSFSADNLGRKFDTIYPEIKDLENTTFDIIKGFKIWLELATLSTKKLKLGGFTLTKLDINYQDYGGLELTNSNIKSLEFFNVKLYSSLFYYINFIKGKVFISAFDQCKIIESNFAYLDVDGVEFRENDLNTSHFRDAFLGSTKFINNKLNSCEFNLSVLDDVTFHSTQLTNTSFKDNTLITVVFKNCEFYSVNVLDKFWDEVKFINCSIRHCSFKIDETTNVSFDGMTEIENSEFNGSTQFP